MVSNYDMEILVGMAGQMRLRPEWSAFAAFCELRGRGMRSDAMRQLELFLAQAGAWAFDARLDFVKYVLEESEAFADRNALLPQPLCRRLVFPTLCEWSEKAPQNAHSHLWLGLLRYDDAAAHLERALASDPSCERARKTLVEWMLGDIEYNQHELPAFYIHDPRIDLKELDRAVWLVSASTSAGWVATVTQEIADLRSRAKNWIAEHPGGDDFAIH